MNKNNNEIKKEETQFTLMLKEKYPNKIYDLYSVCKIINGKPVPLYNETFTQEQVEAFYKKSEHCLLDFEDEEDTWEAIDELEIN